jgi:hypothetical protein
VANLNPGRGGASSKVKAPPPPGLWGGGKKTSEKGITMQNKLDLNELKRQRDDLIRKISLQEPLNKEMKERFHALRKQIRFLVFTKEEVSRDEWPI